MSLEKSTGPAGRDRGDVNEWKGESSARAHRTGSGNAETAERLVAQVERALEIDGLGAAIELLNARTRFRYTGVYRAEPTVLRNIFLFDRENPTLNVSGATAALESTYCSITCAIQAPFSTGDAATDARLVAHPARDSVISYGGVPLRTSGGRAWGTLCHFDVRPRLLPPLELDMMCAVAPVIAQWVIAREGE